MCSQVQTCCKAGERVLISLVLTSSSSGTLALSNLNETSISITSITLQLSSGTTSFLLGPFPLLMSGGTSNAEIPVTFMPLDSDVRFLVARLRSWCQSCCTSVLGTVSSACAVCPPPIACCPTLLASFGELSGQFVVPVGINRLIVTVLGGGGSGGTAYYFPDPQTSPASGGAGGAGSGFQATGCAAVQAGDVIDVQIGSGGLPVTLAASNGNDGGATVVSNATQGNSIIVTALGGQGGLAGTLVGTVGAGGAGGAGACGGGGGAGFRVVGGLQIPPGNGGAGTVQSGTSGLFAFAGTGGCNILPVSVGVILGGEGGGLRGGRSEIINNALLRDAASVGGGGAGGIGQGLTQTNTFTNFSISGAGAGGSAVILGCLT